MIFGYFKRRRALKQARERHHVLYLECLDLIHKHNQFRHNRSDLRDLTARLEHNMYVQRKLLTLPSFNGPQDVETLEQIKADLEDHLEFLTMQKLSS